MCHCIRPHLYQVLSLWFRLDVSECSAIAMAVCFLGWNEATETISVVHPIEHLFRLKARLPVELPWLPPT